MRPRRGANSHLQPYYSLSELISDWQPHAIAPRRAISQEMLSALREARASGKTLRELARQTGVSHETLRLALKVGPSSVGRGLHDGQGLSGT